MNSRLAENLIDMLHASGLGRSSDGLRQLTRSRSNFLRYRSDRRQRCVGGVVGQCVGELLGVANNLQACRLPEIEKEKVRELMSKMMAN